MDGPGWVWLLKTCVKRRDRRGRLSALRVYWIQCLRYSGWGNGCCCLGTGRGCFPRVRGGGGVALLGLWIRAAVLPLTRKHARRILGRYIWCLRPAVGYAPFLSGWWAHWQWGANWLQNCPGSLLKSLLHRLLLFFRAWTPQLLLPLRACRGGGGGETRLSSTRALLCLLCCVSTKFVCRQRLRVTPHYCSLRKPPSSCPAPQFYGNTSILLTPHLCSHFGTVTNQPTAVSSCSLAPCSCAVGHRSAVSQPANESVRAQRGVKHTWRSSRAGWARLGAGGGGGVRVGGWASGSARAGSGPKQAPQPTPGSASNSHFQPVCFVAVFVNTSMHWLTFTYSWGQGGWGPHTFLWYSMQTKWDGRIFETRSLSMIQNCRFGKVAK